MRQPAATTLRGALLTLGQDDPEWLEKVDRQLGNALTGADPDKSMHGIFGWIDPGSEVPQLVREARRRTVEKLSSVRRGPARLELVSAVHTTTVVVAFFDHVRKVLTDLRTLRAPEASRWHQEDRAFVSYLYADEVPMPSATSSFEGHLTDITKWVADRAERVHRAVHPTNQRLGTHLLLGHVFASTTASKFAAAFSAFAGEIPEFVVWTDVVDAEIADQASEWLRSKDSAVSADDPFTRLSIANTAALNQPLTSEPHLPTIDQIYVSPAFRAAEVSPSTRVADDGWWSSGVPPRQDFELMLARYFDNPAGYKLPMLVIGGASTGKSTLTRMLAVLPFAADLAVVRVPLRSADPSLSVAEQVENALLHVTGGRVTWNDLAGHVCVVLLDGLDELWPTEPDPNYLSEVARFQQHESALNRSVAVVVTSRTSYVDQVLIPDRTPVVRLEPFDQAQTRAWVEKWNHATAGTGRRVLTLETVLAHESLARQPRMLSMMARYLTDPAVPDADLSTTALQERLADRRAQRMGMERRVVAVASLGMFNRGRQRLSLAEFRDDLVALGHQVEQLVASRLRSWPLTDFQIASRLLEVLAGISGDQDDDLLFALLSHRLLTTQPSILTSVTGLAGDMTHGRREASSRTLRTLISSSLRPRAAGSYPDYQPTRPTPQLAKAIYSANIALLWRHFHPDGHLTLSPEVIRLWTAELHAEALQALRPLIFHDNEGSASRTGVEFVHRSVQLGTKAIGQVTWSTNGQLLTAISGGRVRFWEVTEDAPPRSVAAHPDTSDVTWHPAKPIAAIVRRKRTGNEKADSPLDTRELVLAGPDRPDRLLGMVRDGTRISWSPDRTELALLDPFMLTIIDVTTGRTLREHLFLGAPRQTGAHAPSPRWTRDGQHVLAVHRSAVHLLRASDLAPVWHRTPGGDVLETFAADETYLAVSISSSDTIVRVYDLRAGQAIALLDEHTGPIVSARFSPDGSLLVTLSKDNTARIWRCRDWQCVATLERKKIERRGGLAFHPTEPLLAVKDGNEIDIVRLDHRLLAGIGPATTARRYANAKVVLVGDTGVGKSGLGLVLSGQPFAPTDSTHGRNVWTFEKSYATLPSNDVQTRETLLWDLAGQPGYRMVHQLHLNEVAVALIVFDARSETDPFAGVQYWSRALAQARRLDGAAAVRMRVYLVAARADRGTAAVSRERIQETLRAFGFDGYIETSAKEGWGVDELIRAVRDGIDWDAVPVVSSNEFFQTIRDFVVEEKQQGRILSTVDDLMHSFRRVQRDTPALDELADRFVACLGRLESVGVVRRMSYGDYVLLRPELLDSYASSLVQAAKDEPDGLGFVREEDALEGRFRIPQDERLTNPQQERILLNAVVQELLRREIALKEVTDREVDLIFPSQFTRERPDAPQLPGKEVVFTFDGHLYSIYSTLAVRLSHSRFFKKHEMWHNSATYRADAGGLCGIAIREAGEGKGELALFYDEQVVPLVRKQFEAYVVEHLTSRAGEISTRRVRMCALCRYTIPDDLVRARIARGKHKITCPRCDDFVIRLVDEPDGVGDVAPVVAEMNSNANAQRDHDVAATTLKGKREAEDYDVFLCHNTKDKPLVLTIARQLEARGILPWLDVRSIQPGSRWQQEMAKGIEKSRTAAVLIGPAGPGPWHEAEMELINDWSARNRHRRVIPVILDGTGGDPELPGFLRLWSTVDMRLADPDPIDQLVWGVTGEQPQWD